MANTFSINESALNETLPTDWLASDDISFNWYWIQNSNIIVEWEWFWFRDYSSRRINLVDRPQSDWRILNDTFFWWRTVSVSGVLVSTDKASLDELIDEFKLAMAPANKLLKWRVNWIIRQINATVSRLQMWTKDNIYIPFSITFESQDAFWQNAVQQSFLIEWQTTSPINEQIDNLWMPTSWPTVIWFNSASWVSTIWMTSNWIGLSITDTFTSWDIIYIDSKTSSVFKNWVELDYDWVFPKYDTWVNQINITINWTFNVDVSIVYPLNIP